MSKSKDSLMEKFNKSNSTLKEDPLSITKFREENAKLRKQVEELQNTEPSSKISNVHVPEKLDSIEKEIDDLKIETQKTMWLIGQRLTVIKERELFKPAYKNFTEYCQRRFEFSRSTAYRFMFIYKNFDYVLALGQGTKLFLLERLREDDRKDVLDWMNKEKPSYREVQKKIKEISKPEDKTSNRNTKRLNAKVKRNLHALTIQIDCDNREVFDYINDILKRYV